MYVYECVVYGKVGCRGGYYCVQTSTRRLIHFSALLSAMYFVRFLISQQIYHHHAPTFHTGCGWAGSWIFRWLWLQGTFPYLSEYGWKDILYRRTPEGMVAWCEVRTILSSFSFLGKSDSVSISLTSSLYFQSYGIGIEKTVLCYCCFGESFSFRNMWNCSSNQLLFILMLFFSDLLLVTSWTRNYFVSQKIRPQQLLKLKLQYLWFVERTYLSLSRRL